MEIQPGRLTGLIGPNGAGKSTLLATLAGTLPVSSGRIEFQGNDITRLPAFRRARRGLVRTFQLPSAFGQLTVLENLLAAAPKNRDYAADLSGGQKRLVEIMRALMLQPRLLLLDEPTAGVHPSIVGQIASYLENLRDEGLTIVMVEHQLGVVERLCDPVIVMAQGKVIGRGSLAELRAQRDVVEAYLVG